jgi:hypothetical protein
MLTKTVLQEIQGESGWTAEEARRRMLENIDTDIVNLKVPTRRGSHARTEHRG